MQRILSCILTATVLLGAAACSDDTVSPDAGPGDMKNGPDIQVTDSSGDSTPPGDSGPVEAGVAVPCQPGGTDPCTGGLACKCCGSIGPAPICLCSKACATDSDCAGTGLPECNTPSPGATGICTPAGYNCCWFCQ